MTYLNYGVFSYDVGEYFYNCMTRYNISEQAVFNYLEITHSRSRFSATEVKQAITHFVIKAKYKKPQPQPQPQPAPNPFDISDEEFEAIKQKNKTPLAKTLTAFWGE